MENNEEIKEAIRFTVRGALAIFSKDPHRFSTRGCDTCKAISEMIDEPWGCVKMAREYKR
jgi:hypothetical protein